MIQMPGYLSARQPLSSIKVSILVLLSRGGCRQKGSTINIRRIYCFGASILCRCISGQRSLIKWDAFWVDAMFKSVFIYSAQWKLLRPPAIVVGVSPPFELSICWKFIERCESLCLPGLTFVCVCLRESKFCFPGNVRSGKGDEWNFYIHIMHDYGRLYGIFLQSFNRISLT